MSRPTRGEHRRTQEERSAATIAKLVQATVDAIVDVGYVAATTREICDRAGVSQGGLFRHFPTRRDLIVATMASLYDTQVAEFRARLAPDLGGESRTRIADQLRAVRSFVRDPASTVFAEVVIASRTEPELRDALVPFLERADRDSLATASRNPVVARMSDTWRRVWVDFAQQVMWIEALWAATLPADDDEDLEIAALVTLMFVLADEPTITG